MSETRLAHFVSPHGQLTAINPAHVAAVQADFYSPGGRYDPGCTVFLNSGEKIHIPESSHDVVRKLDAARTPPDTPTGA